MDRHDHVNWSQDKLIDELVTVKELLEIPRQGERLEQLQRRLGFVAFELMARDVYDKPQAA